MTHTDRFARLSGALISAVTVSAFVAYILTFYILPMKPRLVATCSTMTIAGAEAEAQKANMPLSRMTDAQRAALVSHKGNPPGAPDGKFDLYRLGGDDLGVLMIFKDQCLVNSIGPIPEELIDGLTR